MGVKAGVKMGVMRFAQDDSFATRMMGADAIPSIIVMSFLTSMSVAN